MDEQRRLELLQEAAGLRGMIAEVKAKALLLKQRVKVAEKKGESLEEVNEWVDESLAQMREDLATYSRRLEEIYEELSQDVSTIPRLDGEENFN